MEAPCSLALVEQHVGRQIRKRRVMLGLTQQQLAELLGVTYQQAHKYERGFNRISAGRLYQLASVLGVGVSYFYDGLGNGADEGLPPRQRMSLELARNFSMIRDARRQAALNHLCRAIAQHK